MSLKISGLTKQFLRQENPRVGEAAARMLGNLLQEQTASDVLLLSQQLSEHTPLQEMINQ